MEGIIAFLGVVCLALGATIYILLARVNELEEICKNQNRSQAEFYHAYAARLLKERGYGRDETGE